MRLENQVAIITGGSRGIGYATARTFLREGAKVVITASRPETAQKAVETLQAEFPQAEIMGISPKLESMESVREAFAQVVEKFGRIHILVNNAGVSESTPLENYTEELLKSHGSQLKGAFSMNTLYGYVKNTIAPEFLP